MNRNREKKLQQMEIETSHLYLHMQNLKRNFRLPFQLNEIGFIHDHPRTSITTSGMLELCLRLGSNEEFAVDRFGKETYRCRFPHVCLKPPDLLHTISITQPRDAVYFKYAPELAESMRAAGLLTPPYCWEFTLTSEINNLLQEVRDLFGKVYEYGVVDRLDLLAIELFQRLLVMRNAQKSGEIVDVRIQRIASHLRMNFREPPDLDELLRHNGISRRNFYRCWNSVFDQSPGEYLRELKLEEAFRLLRDTNLPIWMISQRLGFGSTSYFCLLFKQRYNQTPQGFRRNFSASH
ncbi:MAG: AraC family transcriptional regulator [Victivallales bacterium]|jgi:AraC-like DNA-binding protein|nr:AraC family transcriptional regulator [Victivallales bacterium]